MVDSLGKRHKPRADMKELADESQETARRYEDEDLELTANAGAPLSAQRRSASRNAGMTLSNSGTQRSTITRSCSRSTYT